MGKNLRYFSKEDNTNVQLYEDYREIWQLYPTKGAKITKMSLCAHQV